MLADIARLIDACKRTRVLIVGDAILDSYFEGSALRFCREAPVPNVTISRRVDLAGGAANTARNIAALAGRTDFLTVVGDDDEGRRLSEALEKQNVHTGHVAMERGRRTRAKHRVVAESQLLLSFDCGDTGPVGRDAEQQLLELLSASYRLADAVIVADYGYGAVTPRVIAALAALQSQHPRTLVIDSRHRLTAFRNARPTAVKPNFEEFQALIGMAGTPPDIDRAELAMRRAPSILRRTGADIAAITLDGDGAVLARRGARPQRFFARPGLVRCSAGAGDTYVAMMALALTQGLPLETVGELCAGAASVVIGEERTAACSAAQLH
ncbi:MAG: bifunctional heptose 7-phosphate kinase/heptose 1-phosphate adenyltransferase, partial [Rhodospirillaceae bacterium]